MLRRAAGDFCEHLPLSTNAPACTVAAELRSRLVEDGDRAGSEVVITSDHFQFSCLDRLRNDRRGFPQKHHLDFRIGFGRRLQIVARMVYGRLNVLNVWIHRADLPGTDIPGNIPSILESE